MREDQKADRPTVSFEELAYSNMLIVQALVELLAERGLLSNAEVMERVKKLRHETKVSVPRATEPEQASPQDLKSTPVVVTAGDLISANMVLVETLLALFVDKRFLTQGELEDLVIGLRRKAQGIIPRRQ